MDTVAKAWGALPPRVRLLVDGKALQAPAYDAAWRIGTALQAGGKQVQVVALPTVGDSVDLAGISIPASLQGVPAYAALATGERAHAIRDLAEAGALLSLRDSGPLAADVMIGSDALRAGVRAALDALGAQVGAAGADAGSAFAAWRAGGMAGLEKPAATASVGVVAVAGRPTLVVDPAAAGKVAGLLAEQWRSYALGRSLQVSAAGTPKLDGDQVLLSRLGNIAGTMDVVTRADRSASFDLGALSADGRLPEQVVIDVSAAPTRPGRARSPRSTSTITCWAARCCRPTAAATPGGQGAGLRAVGTQRDPRQLPAPAGASLLPRSGHGLSGLDPAQQPSDPGQAIAGQ